MNISDSLKLVSEYFSNFSFLKPSQHELAFIQRETKRPRLNLDEVFIPNSFYGYATLVRFLYGLKDSVLPIVIPHGPAYKSVWLKELKAQLPILAYSSLQEASYLRSFQQFKLNSTVFPFTHPAVSLSRTDAFRKLSFSYKNRGDSLFILAKGTKVYRSHTPDYYLKVVDSFKSAESGFAAHNILLFYDDLLNLSDESLNLIYKGFDRVFCCGKGKEDPLFLSRFTSILAYHRHIVIDQISTAAVVASVIGKEVHFVDQKIRRPLEVQKERRAEGVVRDKNLEGLYNLCINSNQLDKDMHLRSLCDHVISHKINARTLKAACNEALSRGFDLNKTQDRTYLPSINIGQVPFDIA